MCATLCALLGCGFVDYSLRCGWLQSAVQPDFWDGCWCFANGEGYYYYFFHLCGGSIFGGGVDDNGLVDGGVDGRVEVVHIYLFDGVGNDGGGSKQM